MASPDAEVADKSADDAVLVTEAVSGSKDASVKGEGHGRPEKKHHHKGGAKHAHEIPVADLGADIAVEEGAVTEQEGPAGVPAHRAGKGSNKRSRSKGPRSCDSSSESEPSSDSESESESGTEAEEGSEGDRANVGEMLALEETREGVRGGVPLVELLVNRKRRLSARG